MSVDILIRIRDAYLFVYEMSIPENGNSRTTPGWSIGGVVLGIATHG